jgi:hypothetical protein
MPRIAIKKTFYLSPSIAAAIEAHPITAECLTAHGTWHTLLVGALLRALLAGDVGHLEKHLEATKEESARAHSRAQAKGQATLRADPSRRKRRNYGKS